MADLAKDRSWCFNSARGGDCKRSRRSIRGCTADRRYDKRTDVKAVGPCPYVADTRVDGPCPYVQNRRLSSAWSAIIAANSACNSWYGRDPPTLLSVSSNALRRLTDAVGPCTSILVSHRCVKLVLGNRRRVTNAFENRFFGSSRRVLRPSRPRPASNRGWSIAAGYGKDLVAPIPSLRRSHSIARRSFSIATSATDGGPRRRAAASASFP